MGVEEAEVEAADWLPAALKVAVRAVELLHPPEDSAPV